MLVHPRHRLSHVVLPALAGPQGSDHKTQREINGMPLENPSCPLSPVPRAHSQREIIRREVRLAVAQAGKRELLGPQGPSRMEERPIMLWA